MADETLRVLLIEDNPGDARLIREMLAETDGDATASPPVEVVHADRLSAGLARLAEGGIDAVLLDLSLPDSAGMDTFARVQVQAPEVPIVLLTGTDDETLATRVVREGAQDFLVKGKVDADLLRRSLRYAQGRKQAERQLRDSYERLRRAVEGTVRALAAASEMRDPYTAGHQRRVSRLATAMASEMGLPEEQIEGLRMAGIIHDLGKMGVPAEILSKPGRLTEVEFSLIKTHARAGYDMLAEIEFPWPIAEIVLQHHERMDGSGYPQRLAGADILPEARILAAADVVEAMASYRPYRPALGVDRALREISLFRGVHYDEEAVDACLRVFAERGFRFE